MKILCLNGGSSSLKFAVYRVEAASDTPVCITAEDLAATQSADSQLQHVLGKINDAEHIAAIGHRIVFGGPKYFEPTVADDTVLRDLEAFVAVEPLHLRAELDLVYAVKRRLPSLLQVLCFDTAFHRRMPAIARRLPLPDDLDPLIQRYGFHGLSYEYVTSQLNNDAGRTIIAHLGSGASLCAVEDRMPVDTTMGFTALGGLMMASRPGDLDPGIVLQLIRADGYGFEELSDLFYHRSGLRAVSGGTGDMKALISQSPSDARAREAIELFVYQLVKHLGAMIGVLGGLNTLIFTGGIGERAGSIRSAACAAFAHLGVRLDEASNQRNDRVISLPESRVAVEVMQTDENLAIARHVTRIERALTG
jgi:acetate kinase